MMTSHVLPGRHGPTATSCGNYHLLLLITAADLADHLLDHAALKLSTLPWCCTKSPPKHITLNNTGVPLQHPSDSNVLNHLSFQCMYTSTSAFHHVVWHHAPRSEKQD